jgi:hypothetical protein
LVLHVGASLLGTVYPMVGLFRFHLP